MINKKEIREMILADVVRMYGPDELERNAEYWEAEIKSVFAFYEDENEKPAEPAIDVFGTPEAQAECKRAHEAGYNFAGRGLWIRAK